MKHYKRISLAIILPLHWACIVSSSSQQTNGIKQIDFHQMSQSAQPNNVELGRLSFYFEHEPNIMPIGQRNKPGTYVFLFPHMNGLHNNQQKKIRAINSAANGLYTINFEKVYTPVNGLRLTIICNDAQIALRYDAYQSIKQEPGIVFYWYNKPLLKHMQDKGTPLLQTALVDIARTIVIDCGHGGKDSGARGYYGTVEKEINLKIGLELAHLLHDRGINVFLTRDYDRTLGLDERTSFANKSMAHAFISIHTNAAHKQSVGIETFYLKSSLLRQQFNTLDAGDLALVQKYMGQNSIKSEQLAHCVQQSVVAEVSAVHEQLINRCTKEAVSQVLLGTIMPAALIEIGFISHEYEAQLLKQDHYQKRLAKGIYNGVIAYFDSLI